MPLVQEGVEQVCRIDVDQYKYGFETLIEIGKGPQGPPRRIADGICRRSAEIDLGLFARFSWMRACCHECS
jgi:Fe-S cluster assembly protein SufB